MDDYSGVSVEKIDFIREDDSRLQNKARIRKDIRVRNKGRNRVSTALHVQGGQINAKGNDSLDITSKSHTDIRAIDDVQNVLMGSMIHKADGNIIKIISVIGVKNDY